MTSEELRKEVLKDHIDCKPDHWRLGQFVFNYIDYVYGVSREVQFKHKIDCYHNDSAIDEFIDKCAEIITINFEEEQTV